MFKNREIADERVQSDRYQIMAISGSIFSIGIPIDILYKAIYLKLSANAYTVELIIFLVAATVFVILGIAKKNIYQVYNKKGRSIFKFRALLSSIAFAAFFLISDIIDGGNLVFIKGHIGWTVAAFMTLVIISWIIDVLLMKMANREKD